MTTQLPHLRKDRITTYKQITIPEFDYYIEAGRAFHAMDSTGNIGGEGAPVDTIEIYFTTPAVTSKEIVASFGGFCSTAAAVVVLREAYTAGGGASGDAKVPLNMNRTSANTSTLASTMKYQADAITSGAASVVLWTEIIAAGSRAVSEDHFWILAPSTTYGFSLYLAAAGVANIEMHWVER